MPVFTGTNAPETLNGTEGDDDFYPLGGNDTINALGGNDRFFGATNLGIDHFNGGAGYDTARLDVLDYTDRTLSLRLDTSGFFVYRPESGFRHDLLAATDTERLELVLGGSNSRMSEIVVHVFSVPAVFLDFYLDARANLNGISNRFSGGIPFNTYTVLGTEFADVLRGTDLFGYGGDDTLTGERLAGGVGNDTYFVSPGTVITEFAGEGFDVARAFGAFTLPDHVEALSGSGGAATAIGRGNGQANSIGGFGHAFGMGGDDVLTGVRVSGGAGNDLLQGIGSIDTADYATAASGVFVTLDSATPTATNDGDGGTDTLVGIENLTGSAFNDVLIGDGGVNVLIGGLGADYLIGLAGADVLHGGSGASNTLQGGLGDDRYVVSAVGDSLVEFAGEGMDTVETALSSLTLRDNFEILRFTGVGSFTGTGSAQDNQILGGAGADLLIGMGGDDRLEGGDGADTFRGGSGADQFIGGAGLDTADYSAAGAAVTVRLNTSTATNDGEGGVDTFNGVENVTGSAFNDVLIGEAGANVLMGGAGGDYLIGLAGADVLIGGSGASNQLQGGLGDDRYIVTAVGDSLVEFAGEGTDTVETTLGGFTLAANVENLLYTGAGSFTAIGNASNNTITGGAGSDTFTGGRGDDAISGGLGTDTVLMSGVRADYTIQAGAGYVTIGDSVVGRDGIDTLVGIERIRFSDGTVLDITPPAPSPAEEAEAVLARIRPSADVSSDDVALNLHPSGSPWDSM